MGARRDADRSREAILDAAERLFAAHGFEAASFSAIGEAAGVSRATPSYFFGSKEELYAAVLERLYAARSAALGPAFAALASWAEPAPLRPLLGQAVGAYLGFLHGRPTFVDIVEREALAGGERLRAHRSTVMEDAFAALAERRSFDAGDAVLALVGLAYTPVAHRTTMLRRQGERIDDAAFRRRRQAHITDVLLHIMVR